MKECIHGYTLKIDIKLYSLIGIIYRIISEMEFNNLPTEIHLYVFDYAGINAVIKFRQT